MNTNNFITRTLLSFSAITLIACGGGGGGGIDEAKTEPTLTSYPPNSEKLLNSANDSSELYVEEGFTFNPVKNTRLILQINNENSQAKPYSRLNIYLVENDALNETNFIWTDEMSSNAQLIAGGQTNAYGEFSRLLEFPPLNDEKPILMIEVNALGIENKTLVTIESDQTNVTLGL